MFPVRRHSIGGKRHCMSGRKGRSPNTFSLSSNWNCGVSKGPAARNWKSHNDRTLRRSAGLSVCWIRKRLSLRPPLPLYAVHAASTIRYLLRISGDRPIDVRGVIKGLDPNLVARLTRFLRAGHTSGQCWYSETRRHGSSGKLRWLAGRCDGVAVLSKWIR